MPAQIWHEYLVEDNILQRDRDEVGRLHMAKRHKSERVLLT
jgi:hypothetical protein